MNAMQLHKTAVAKLPKRSQQIEEHRALVRRKELAEALSDPIFTMPAFAAWAQVMLFALGLA